MLTIPWSSTAGWGAPKIEPYGPLALDPSSTVLHYAPCLFEGMKAYVDKEGVARLFRPDKNMERMNKSAARLAFPVRSSFLSLSSLLFRFLTRCRADVQRRTSHDPHQIPRLPRRLVDPIRPRNVALHPPNNDRYSSRTRRRRLYRNSPLRYHVPRRSVLQDRF